MKDEEVNTGKHNDLLYVGKTHSKFLMVSVFLGLLIFGCEESKYSQCEQIFYIARSVNKSTQDMSNKSLGTATLNNTEESPDMKKWLEAANMMNLAANNIMALEISNGKLIKYRHRLATVYNIYAQATYDAVKARENKNTEALKAARIDAEKAGEMQQSLVQEINTYCLNK